MKRWFFALILPLLVACGSEESHSVESPGEILPQSGDRKVVVEDDSRTAMAFFEVKDLREAASSAIKDSLLAQLHNQIAVPDSEGIATYESVEEIPEGLDWPILYSLRSLDKVPILRHRNNRKVRVELLPPNEKGQDRISIQIWVNEGNRWRAGLNPGEFRFPSDAQLAQGAKPLSDQELTREIAQTLVLCLYK